MSDPQSLFLGVGETCEKREPFQGPELREGL